MHRKLGNGLRDNRYKPEDLFSAGRREEMETNQTRTAETSHSLHRQRNSHCHLQMGACSGQEEEGKRDPLGMTQRSCDGLPRSEALPVVG